MAGEIVPAGQVSHIEGAGRDANKTENHAKHVAIDVVWLNSMKLKLGSTGGNSCPKFSICRVPAHIRKHDHAAYNPKIVSIGPFHHGRRNLRAMEEHKERSLHQVLTHCKRGNDLVKFLEEMKAIETAARGYYSENIKMSSQEFVKMMVLDGFFIIHFILMQTGAADSDPVIYDSDPVIYNNMWMSTVIHHDLLLLENQLPFCVLECLWKLIGRPSDELTKAALAPFSSTFEGYTIDGPKIKRDVFHLLHLIHLSFQPASPTQRSPTQKSPCRSVIAKLSPLQFLTQFLTFLRPKCLVDTHDRPTTPGQQSLPESKDKAPPPCPSTSCIGKLLFNLQCLPFLCPPISPGKDKAPLPWTTIPSATELQEAGVKFKSKKSASSFFDLTFEHGLMEMPALWVSGYANARFRNFIAFEQCFPVFGNHFTTYCIFIDFLINTSRDVSILSESGIVRHGLGSNEDVALLFNKLCKEIVWDSNDSYLDDVFKKATQYTKKRPHKWRAKLVHDYFSNPWSIISLMAAIIVISVAFVQTFFTVFPYFRPAKP